MRDWHTHTLRFLIGSPISGSRPLGGVREDTEGVPSLGGENILANGGITYEVLKRIPHQFFQLMPKGHLSKEDVLINKDGAQTGKVGFYDGTFDKAAVNEHLFILRSKNGAIEQRLLYYYLLFSETQSAIVRRITGSAQPGLNSQFVDAIRLTIPSAQCEQRYITKVLSVVDEAIEQTESLIIKTRQIKTGLMHDLFTRGVTVDGQLRPSRKQVPRLYKESPLGWIPKEWTYDRLIELTTQIVDGVHHTPNYVEHGVPFVTVKNLTCSRSIDFDDLNYITRQDHLEFQRRADPRVGDVLVTKDGTLGVSRLVEAWHPEFSIFVSVALLRPIAARLRARMLHMFFDSGTYEGQLGHLSAGTGLKHIHLEHFRRFIVPLPDVDEQDRMGAIVDSIDTKMRAEEFHLKKLRKIKNGLMEDLLTGRVRTRSEAEADVGEQLADV